MKDGTMGIMDQGGSFGIEDIRVLQETGIRRICIISCQLNKTGRSAS